MGSVLSWQETSDLAGSKTMQRFTADGVEIELFPRLPFPDLNRNIQIIAPDIDKRGAPGARWQRFKAWWEQASHRTVAKALDEGGLTLADVQWEIRRGSIAYSREI